MTQKFSRHVNEQYERRTRYLDRIKSTYRTAIHFCSSSRQLIDAQSGITTEAAGKLTARNYGYVDGYKQALWDNLYNEHLVFGKWIGGTFYSTHSGRDDYYQKHGIEPKAFADNETKAAHYWKHNVTKIF